MYKYLETKEEMMTKLSYDLYYVKNQSPFAHNRAGASEEGRNRISFPVGFIAWFFNIHIDRSES